MNITRIDFQCCRGLEASHDTSAFVALNPSATPGSLAFAGAVAGKGSIGSQVACRLSLEHFVEGILAYFEKRGQGSTASSAHTETSLQVLESAFKRANTSVYDFGHRLAAGGRMAAALLGLVIEDDVIAAGRVGPGSAYLFRTGELFPFFESKAPASSDNIRPGAELVGANSLVAVELSSISIRPDDVVCIFAADLSTPEEASLVECLNNQDFSRQINAELISTKVLPSRAELPFAGFARIGPKTIYLGSAKRDRA